MRRRRTPKPRRPANRLHARRLAKKKRMIRAKKR